MISDEMTLLPLRMINEYVYCPRLFWFEYVDREFEHSPETVDGIRVHRNVDQASPRTVPDDDVPFGEVRSLTLSSERLGIIGNLDIAEFEAGEASPVDYKRGRVPAVAQRAYEPERVQLCLQGLLLREAGYRSERGFLYFAESHARVEVMFDEALIAASLEAVRSAQALSRSTTIPPPLEDSPKCPRCALVGICLPDETNAMRATEPRNIRPLVVPADVTSPLYIIKPGSRLGRSEDVLQVRTDGEVVDEVRFIDVSHVSLFGNVQISTQALRELIERNIPVFYFSYGAWLKGMTVPPSGHSIDARIAQYAASENAEISLQIAQAIVEGKIRNQRTLVRRSLRGDAKQELGQMAFLINQCRRTRSQESLLGIEGSAARTYFACFAKMFRDTSTDFSGRNRRPPRDPVNATLSFLYALLVRDCVAALLSVGLEPGLGIYHRVRLGRPSLALDLAEEFRPLIADSITLSAFNTSEVDRKHFVLRGAGVSLNDGGRRAVIAAYERRLSTTVMHELFGYGVSYRRIVALQARLLARRLQGDIPSYVPFTTR